MHVAEAGLLSLARRFSNEGGTQMEIFDTKIPTSCVPLEGASRCMLGIGDKEDGDFYRIHGVRVTNSSEKNNNGSEQQRPPLVLLHGYANGALYFYRNLLGLQKHFKSVYSLDMLGWGLSSRPPFKTKEDTVECTEAVFVESLEAWRKANGIEKMILGGHSMGGYFSVAYCEKYPERVDRLILISPVGVPHIDEDDRKIPSGTPLYVRTMISLAKFLWRNNITPGAFIRSISEKRGRGMVIGYFDKRIPAITAEDEKRYLTDYMYLNSVLPGSAEYALNKVLKPGAYARNPAVYRIPKLQVSNVSFIYGEHDWMDFNGGLQVQRACEQLDHENSVDDGTNYKRKSPNVEVHSVRDAGHLLLLENWEEFNSAMILAGGGTVPTGSPLPKKLKC